MPKILNIVQRGNAAEHWSNASAFNEKDIKGIADPSGMTDKKQITSIPSPFARIDLFKTAFRSLVDHATDHLGELDGSTIHHKLVSDCLDMIQIFFEWDTFSEDPSKQLKIITWNKRENLDLLINSSNAAHQLLGETLKLFFEQDNEAYNFNDLEDFFLVEYDYKVIGGTSPVTMCFTTANDLSFVDLSVGQDKFFDAGYCPLYKREKEFQKYLHFLFKAEPDLRSKMKEVFDYLELSLKKLGEYDSGLRDEINNELRNFKDGEFKRRFPIINTGKEGQNIYLLGIEMRKKRVDKGSISGESDFVIGSTKWDEKHRDTPSLHKPLVLQNNYSKRKMRYVGGGEWERNTVVPFSYGNTPLDKRILPGQNMAYPHLTVDDFLEPNLIKLVYPLNHQFFDGNMLGFRTGHVGFLLPIKKTYFDYFEVEDLRKTTIDGDKILELSDRAGGGVAVTLRIPVAKSGEYITLERMYYPDAKPEISDTQNKGGIVECQFSVAIFPFVKLPENNQYRVLLVDRDIKDDSRHFDYNLHFYNEKDTAQQIDNPFKMRSQKLRDEATSKFYMINQGFDFIEIENGDAKGILVPFFDKRMTTGTKKFTFAVDFGTTNTHIEYSIEGSEPRPFEIKEEDKQYVTTYPANYNIVKAPELSLTVLREFIPQIISNGTEYSFPFRTAISEHEALNHAQPVHALADLNIPFYYEKMIEGRGTDVFKEIKWSNFGTEDDARNRVEKFLENLLFMMRNKVILNQGNLSKTELIWFYPSSMMPTQQDDLEELWMEQFQKYFPEVNDVDAKLRKMSESLAPFHYYKEFERVDSLAYPVVSIDIGGGTTDIVVFFDNKPKFLTSFKFAGNALFGDAFNSSSRYNGFVKRYKEKIRGLLNDNAQPDLLRVLENLENERSQEMLSFFFSLDSNQNLKASDINIGFSKMLKDDGDFKVVFLIFYAAIIYHVAKLMKNAGLNMPRYICFSGNGSRSINLLDTSRNLKRVSTFAQLLFEKVFNEAEENNEKTHRYGEGRQASSLDIKQVNNPKEVTCKGGILGTTSRDIEDMKMVLLGTKTDMIVNSRIPNVSSETMRYDEVNHDIYDMVIDEIKHFIDTLFDLDEEYSFNRNLGIKISELDRYKSLLFEDLRQYLMQGIEAKKKTDLANNAKARVEETLFFYPLIGALNNLASKVVEE